MKGATAQSADTLLRTVKALRGTRGLARRGLFRFATFEEAQAWLRSEMSQRSALQPSTISDASAEPSRKPGPATS